MSRLVPNKPARCPSHVEVGVQTEARESIVEEVRSVIDNADDWLDTENPLFGGLPPRKTIGTPQEGLVREWVMRIKHGVLS